MLKLRILTSAGWTISARLVARGLDFVTLLILARMLVPADFGLTALAMSVVMVADMVLEVPLVQALVRLPQSTRSHYDTAFTLGLMRGAVVAVIVIGAAWPATMIYKDDRLLLLISALAISPLARSLFSPMIADQMRNLKFSSLFVAQVTGKAVATVSALAVLWLGGGYWAIATNTVVASAMSTIISYVVAPYRPQLSLSKFRDFAGFVGWFSLSQVLTAIGWQLDRMLLGIGVRKDELGQYSMAADLSVMPTQTLIGPAMQPVMSALVQVRESRERLTRAFLMAANIAMLISVPICLMFLTASDWIVHILIGPAWTDASLYLSLLGLTILPAPYYQVVYSLALAEDRTRVIFILSAVSLMAQIILIPLGILLWSIMGVILAKGIAALILFAGSALFAKKLIGVSVSTQALNLWKVALAGTVMVSAILLICPFLIDREWNVLVEMALLLVTGGGSYGLVLLATGGMPKIGSILRPA